jgi:hypothetical protein
MSNFLPCPFCGGAVSKCDESPLYGGSIMHDETECLFKNNLLFHGNINDRWNSRPIENALRSRIAELEKALRIADDEYAYATSQYYNEPVPPPSSYDRWLSLAQNPAPPEEAK